MRGGRGGVTILRTLRRLDDRAARATATPRDILVDGRTAVNYEMVAPVVRGDGSRSPGPVLLHRQRRSGSGSRQSTQAAAGRARRLISPAAPRCGAGTPTSPPTSCGRRCRAAPRASRCSMASAASTASTRRPESMRQWHRPVLRQRAAAAQLRRRGAIDADSPAARAGRHAEGRLPGRRLARPRCGSCGTSGSIRHGRRCSTRRPGRRPRR